MPFNVRMLRAALPIALSLAAACRGDFEPDPTGPGVPPPPPPTGTAMPFRIGSFSFDYAKAVVTDVIGNGYVASYYSGSVDFDPSSGATVRPSLGATDIAVAKYAPTGALTWVVSLGGGSTDQPFDVALAPDGGVIVTGFAGPGVNCNGSLVQNNGGRDILIARISIAGVCEWAISVGSAQDDEGRNVVVQSDGDVLVTGLFRGTADFDAGGGNTALISRGGTDGFVARYAANGAFRSVAQIGGISDDAALAIAKFSNDEVVVAGEFRGVAILGSALAPLPLTSVGDADYFVARYTDLLGLRWAFRGGGTTYDQVNMDGVTVEADGSIVVAGNFSGVADVDTGPGTGLVTSLGGQDIFVARYDGDGFWLGIAKALGGIGSDGAHGLTTDAVGNLVVVGWFQGSVDFDPGAGTRVITGLGTSGAADGFVLSLDQAVNLRWVVPIGATVAGDANFAIAAGAAVNPFGQVWVVGRFFGSADLDPGSGAVFLQSGGDADQFVTRYLAGDGSLDR